MATSRNTEFEPNGLSTDERFRAACKDIRQALEAAGLERTADTGQINLETVTRPSFNADAGFDIFKFTDAAQAESPCFVKVYYGLETTEGFWLRLGVGDGSDGEGNLTGDKLDPAAAKMVLSTSSVSNVQAELIVSSSDSALVIVWALNGFETTSNGDLAFGGVERLRSSTGEAAEGFVVYAARERLLSARVVSEGTAWPALSTYLAEQGFICLIGNNSSSTQGEDTYLGVYVPVGLKAHPPILGLLGASEDDFVGGTEGKVSRYGTDREYVKVGSKGAEFERWAMTGVGNVGLMVLAE